MQSTPFLYSFRELWDRIGPARRLIAAKALYDNPQCEEARGRALSCVEDRLKVRRKTIRTWTTEEKSKRLASLQIPDEELAKDLVKQYYFSTQSKMMGRFLDLVHVDHENGCYQDDPAPKEALELAAAVDVLHREFDIEEVDLYVNVLYVNNRTVWGALRPAPAAGTEAGDDTEVGSNDELEEENPRATHEGLPSKGVVPRNSEADRLTVLDDVVTLSIIEWATGIEGALDNDQIDDLVEELLHENGARHRSYYHRGFLDVLQEKEPQPHFRGENESRRLWYLSGAVVGLARRKDSEAIAQLCLTGNLSSFGRDLCPRSSLVAQFIFEALCETNRASLAARFLKPHLINNPSFAESVLEWGTKLLRSERVEEADLVLALLEKAVANFEHHKIPPDFRHRLLRRRAHCMRLRSDFLAAEKVLEELSKQAGVAELSTVLTDLAMVKAGFRGLFDLEIPGDEKKCLEFCKRLTGIRELLDCAMAASGQLAHAQYCLGVLALISCQGHTANPSTAASLLEPAVTYMLARTEIYDTQDLRKRAQFYLALAFAEKLEDVSRQQYCIELFREAIKNQLAPPPSLLRRYLEALSMSDPPAAKDAAELVLEQVQSRPGIMHTLLDAEIARHSPVLWTALYNWVCGQVESRNKRFRYLVSLLQEAAFMGLSGQVEACLDQLEHLAIEGVEVDKYVNLLRDPSLYDSAWDKSDAAWSAIGVLERAGRYAEAICLLEAQFNAILHSEQYGAFAEAREIVEELAVLPDAKETAEALQRLLDARTAETEPVIAPTVASRPVNIVVVGGDERQARLDDGIKAQVGRLMPNVTVTFRHTCWSSNWGDQFNDMRQVLERADAVVVLQLIRTNLGRLIRKRVSLWIGCYGRNRLSIVTAIETAARYAVAPGEREKTAAAKLG